MGLVKTDGSDKPMDDVSIIKARIVEEDEQQ